MNFTVENVCGLLVGSKLLTAEGVKAIHQRWQNEAGDAVDDMAQFTRWLVARQYLTEYQAALIAKGYTEGFFINHYKILEHLGKERMARVYKAVHQLGQVVAIKVLPPSHGKDAVMAARFHREAKLALRIKHPNVVRSFQLGRFKGLHYLVMEYLEGETLEEVLRRRKKLPVNEAARLIHQTLQGLQHLHSQGLVHRDLKPSNLMLIPAPKNGADTTMECTVKILDIGLGRTFNIGNGHDEPLTPEGPPASTSDYLAPEQARDPRAVDIRADIYSLGCVFYHALTGQPPFPDTNVLSQMARHASESPKPLRELAPGIPNALEALVLRMLAKEPGKRFATPEQAGRALQPFIGGGAIAKASEEGPQLKKFLTWLEMNRDSRGSEVPMAETAAGARLQGPVAAQPEDFDVELLPQAQVGAATGALPTTNRDWYFLALGAIGVIVAGLVGFAVAYLSRG